MTDREMIEKWKNKALPDEEYQTLLERLPGLSHANKVDMFLHPRADLIQQQLLSIMVVDGTIRSPWERRMTVLALVLGSAGSVAGVSSAVREYLRPPMPPVVIRELASHTEAASELPQLMRTNPFSTALPLRLSTDATEESGSTPITK